MKRQDLIQQLTVLGCILIRHGSNHDLYRNPKTGAVQAVPRHAEIKDFLAQAITRKPSSPP